MKPKVPLFPAMKAFPRGARPLVTVQLMVLLNELRGILRPSARRDLLRFLADVKTQDELRELLEWGERVLAADHVERYLPSQPRTKRAVASIRLRVFRRPERAFQVRWMHKPRNAAAAARAKRQALSK